MTSLVNLAFMCFRRQKEQEQKIVEEETVKRIEEMVALRVAEELEKRKDEIEAEVLRRVEEAKQIMEQQMLQELERRRKERLEEENRREVLYYQYLHFTILQRMNIEFAISNESDVQLLDKLHLRKLLRDIASLMFPFHLKKKSWFLCM